MGLGREFNLFWFTAEAKKLIHKMSKRLIRVSNPSMIHDL